MEESGWRTRQVSRTGLRSVRMRWGRERGTELKSPRARVRWPSEAEVERSLESSQVWAMRWQV
jgi:hypothetical protein